MPSPPQEPETVYEYIDQPDPPSPTRAKWLAISIIVLTLAVLAIIIWQVWPSSDDLSRLSPEEAATRVAEEFATATLIPRFTPEGPSILALSVPPLVANGELSVVGRVNPGADVDILVNGDRHGAAQVDEDGIWSYDLILSTPGLYEIAVSALLSGTQLFMDGDPAHVIYPTVTPTPSPSATWTATWTPSPTPTILPTSTTTETPLPTATPAPAAAEPLTQLAGPSIIDRLIPETISAGEVELVGLAEPGASVNVLVDDTLAAAAVADEEGVWSVTAVLTPGNHVISVQARLGDTVLLAVDDPVFITALTSAESEALDAAAMVTPATSMMTATKVITPTSAVILMPTATLSPPTEPEARPDVVATFQAGAARFIATMVAMTPEAPTATPE